MFGTSIAPVVVLFVPYRHSVLVLLSIAGVVRMVIVVVVAQLVLVVSV